MESSRRKIAGTKLLILIAIAIMVNTVFVLNTVHVVSASTSHPQDDEGGTSSPQGCTSTNGNGETVFVSCPLEFKEARN